MSNMSPSRRRFLSSAAVAAVAAPTLTTEAFARRPADNDFDYEVKRTEAEWRAMLSDEEYDILRAGGTERKFTSRLTIEERAGAYTCRGCDLKLYDAEHKVIYPIGWAFWFHSEDNAVLTGKDVIPAEMSDGEQEMGTAKVMSELHCRRCGSHLGHMVSIKNKPTHCINGSALVFTPAEA